MTLPKIAPINPKVNPSADRRSSMSQAHDASEILKHEKKNCTPAEHEATLRAAFNAMDGDKSGMIDILELEFLLKEQGHSLSETELKAIMAHLDTDGNTEELSFEEFQEVMSNLAEGTDLGQMADHFANEMKTVMSLAAAAGPLWEQLAEKKRNGVELTPWESFQNRAGQALDGGTANIIIMVLIVVDVICVICELLLGATACRDCTASCVGHDHQPRFLSSLAPGTMTITDVHRQLGGAAPPLYVNTSIACAQDMHVLQTCVSNGSQVDWNTWLHWVSVGILGIFALQLILLMMIYQRQFFCSFAYMADSVVVGAALVLENIPSAKQGGLFVVLLSWRILRIVHGVISSVEINNTMKKREIDAEAVELSKKHERETAELHSLITKQMELFAVQKQKVQSLIDVEKTAEAHPETAAGFISLCLVMEQLNDKLKTMRDHIHEDVEEHKHQAHFDKNPFNNDAAHHFSEQQSLRTELTELSFDDKLQLAS